MHMKQLLLKGMATRLLGVLAAFFMMVAVQGMAQEKMLVGSSSAGSGADKAVSKLVLPVNKLGQIPLESSKRKVQTRAGGNVLKITSGGVDTEYADWSTAMQALESGDKITLLSKVILYEAAGDKMPDKPCTIDGGNNTLEFNTNGFAGSCSLREGIAFQNIHLDAGAIVANGKSIVFDTGVTVADNCDVYGGGSLDTNVENTSITIKAGATLSDVYGGGYAGKVTSNTNIVVEGGKVTTIFGGGYDRDAVVEGSTNITIKNVTSISTVYGGGYYTPVKETANIKIEGGSIDYIIGGGGNESATCKNTNLIINGGSFGQNIQGYRYNVMGGGYSAPVTEKAKVTISDGIFNCFVTAGGGFDNVTTATCGSTELNITGGTFYKWTYGGGWESPVLGTATVKVSGSPNLITLCGGGVRSTASCNKTEVTVLGGEFGGHVFGGGENGDVIKDTYVSVTGGTIQYYVFGGGSQGQVLGSTKVVIDGATMTAEGHVLGGGWGDDYLDDGYSPDNGRVGNSNITINNVKGDNILYVYGNGFCSSVTNNINITVNGGKKISLSGLYSDQNYALSVGGDLNLVLNGGAISLTSLVVNDLMKKNTIGGKATITVLPDIDATNLTDISSGNPSTGVLKDATFVFKDCGTSSAPFEILYNLQGFTTVKLDNSFVKSKIKQSPAQSPAIFVDTSKSNTFIGSGWCEPVNVGAIPSNVDAINDMKTIFTLAASDLVDEDVFKVYPASLGSFYFFRVGNTYRAMLGKNDDLFSTITIDEGITNETLSVHWKDTELINGDKVPFRTFSSLSSISELTIEALPDEGYNLKEGSIKVYKTGDENTPVELKEGNAFTLPEYNVTVTAEFEKIPYVPEPEPTPTVFYTVGIPSVEGATTDPVAGDYEIQAWDSFRFYLTLDKDYDQSEPIVTTDRGETLAPRTSDGAYIVKYVRSDVEIFIDGIVKNPDPVANAEIESGTKAWVSNHRLFIRTDKAENVFIYTFGGELRKTFRSAGGEEQIPLSSGTYIIRIGEDDFKVIL